MDVAGWGLWLLRSLERDWEGIVDVDIVAFS